MSLLGDFVKKSERVIDLATSLMVYQSMMDERENELLESVVSDAIEALDGISSELEEFLPKEKKEDGGCSSCRGL